MPSPTNAEIVTGALRAQNRGDEEAFAAVLHPDVVWKVKSNLFDVAPVIHGRAALLKELRRIQAEHGRVEATMHEVRESGDRVFVAGTVTLEDGIRFPRAWVWRMQDGRAIEVESFTSAAAALEAFVQEERPTGD